jgi:hypothetical protein
MNYSEGINPVGHLEIYKKYTDTGLEELVFEDHNLIVSGMGFTLAKYLCGSGVDLSSFQITLFQVGVSGDDAATSATNDLGSPLSIGAGGWGLNTALDITTHNLYKAGSLVSRDFGVINPALIQKIRNDTVRWVLVLDENTANGLNLNEIGLFSHNPLELSPPASVLCAYRKFDNIAKTQNFTLIFKWSITL